jgi:formylglycine-generating enzyme
MMPRRALVFLTAAAAVAGCNAIFGITAGEPTSSSTSAGGAGGGATSSATSSQTSTTSSTSSAGGSPTTSSSSTGGPPPDTTLIPAGMFNFLDEQSGNPTLMKISHDFYMDTLEVSVARFQKWVDAGQKPPCATGTCSLDPGGPYEGQMMWDAAWNVNVANQSFEIGCNVANNTDYNTPTFSGSDGSVPMNCVDWYHAAAFCFSEGKRLPTETEWQYVATGRGAGHKYPWGNQDPTDCSLAIWTNNAPGPTHNGCGFPKPGGSAPDGASLDGLLDMAGSVFEWCWDYDGSYPGTPKTDYAGPSVMANRSDRGGSWAFDPAALRATYRDATPPDSAYADVGARCAKTKLP